MGGLQRIPERSIRSRTRFLQAPSMVLTGNNAYGFRAAMDERLTGYRANDLLLRHSLARFEERFGARPFPYSGTVLSAPRLPPWSRPPSEPSNGWWASR